MAGKKSLQEAVRSLAGAAVMAAVKPSINSLPVALILLIAKPLR